MVYKYFTRKETDKQKHAVGTPRSNRRNNPPGVVKMKLKREEITTQQNKDKIIHWSVGPNGRPPTVWYKWLAFSLVTSTTAVTALHLYTKVTNSKIGIIKFRESIIHSLVRQNTERIDRYSKARHKHILKDAGQKRLVKRMNMWVRQFSYSICLFWKYCLYKNYQPSF